MGRTRPEQVWKGGKLGVTCESPAICRLPPFPTCSRLVPPAVVVATLSNLFSSSTSRCCRLAAFPLVLTRYVPLLATSSEPSKINCEGDADRVHMLGLRPGVILPQIINVEHTLLSHQ